LQSIHRAFNETAGRIVFTESLDEFFNDHDQFAPLQHPIDEYFTHSRRYFFAGITDDQGSRYSRSELIAFVQACRDIERGLT
jgi:mxaA protein